MLVQARQIGSANDEIFFPQAQTTAIEARLKGAACFKIFQVKLNPVLTSFKCQMCLLSSVLSLLFGSLKEDLWFEYLVLKRVLSKACIGLGWPVVLRCNCGLVDHG